MQVEGNGQKNDLQAPIFFLISTILETLFDLKKREKKNIHTAIAVSKHITMNTVTNEND